MENLNIFEMLYDDYKIKKRGLRVIELFAGYGSQSLALKYLGVNYEHWKICEWAIHSLIAYASVHRNELKDYGKDFTEGMTKDEIIEKLLELGISKDNNAPATKDNLKSVKEDRLRLCYNSIIWSHNLVDVSRVSGDDLEIVDTDKYDYLLTYSFPCQNLSVAGRMEKLKTRDEINDDNLYDIENRSNMLWQVDRILSECEHKPTILLLENVIGVHGAGNEIPFRQWISRLEKYGYQSYWHDLSATDYKIPQSRNRCFMVSILGNSWNYKFPKKQKLDLRLRDMLQDEDNVDEKYVLSEALLNCFMSEGTGKYPRRERFLQNMNRENQDIANSITTLAGNRPTDNFVIRGLKNKALKETLEKNNIEDVEDVGYIDAYNREIKTDGNSGTITTRVDAANNSFVIVKNGKIRIPLKRGYSCEVSPEQEDTDKIDFIGNYSKSNFNQTSIVGKNGIAPTVTENHGQVTAILVGGIGEKKSNGGTQYYQQDRVYDADSIAISVTTSFNPYYANDYVIRKLTPRECLRLQAVKDEDITHILENQVDSMAFKLAGDSITITVLMAIFSIFFDKDWTLHFNPKEWWKNE